MRRARVLFVAAAVLAAGCTGGSGHPEGRPAPQSSATTKPSDPARTFRGILADVDKRSGWRHDPRGIALASGGRDDPFTIGPGVLRLTDGRRIPFGARTHGGNSCVPLLTRADVRPVTGFEHLTQEQLRRAHGIHDPCIVVGELRPDGSAAWFALRELDEGEALTAAADVTLSNAVAYDEATRVVTLRGGGAFVVPRGLVLSCFGARGLPEMIGRGVPHQVWVSLRTKQVTGVGCLGRQ